MDEIDKLLQQIRANGDEVWIAGAAPDKAVARLERALGVQLPPSYRDFLTRFGAMTVAGSPISGIPDGEPLGEGTGWLYGDTLQFRDEWQLPEHLLVVQPDEDAGCESRWESGRN